MSATVSDQTSSRPSNAASTPLPRTDGRTTSGGHQRSGAGQKGYDDVLDLNGCYFVYVCVRYPGRARNLEARKEAKCRRKDRIGTIPLS